MMLNNKPHGQLMEGVCRDGKTAQLTHWYSHTSICQTIQLQSVVSQLSVCQWLTDVLQIRE